MGVKGQQTRENILACAEGIILQRGYSGTSIEDIIREAGITKGGFFYHFDGKSDLAKKLMLRYLEQDKIFFSMARLLLDFMGSAPLLAHLGKRATYQP